ncbi:pentatricopeptide repeat-containing protein At1g77405-like [Capsicum annuum]|uniref:pentatricopeptide repeat-containing protein At1g77405-like n=1 Tax=Capsicum annuum TaxID=4072 RepID=UPI001FB18086|nr:pentatricopeptide repeat-containing protein At1g77405-like [Capsicum annuum]
MFSSRSLSSPFTQNQNLLIDQVMAAIFRNRPCETNVVASIPQPFWTVEAVSQVLRSIPRFLFQSPRSYNTLIFALCRVGNFKKAKFLMEQMELPGFRCPPDVFTYTILISSYCRYSMETGCRKAIRRRIWEANHLFRLMLFKGFVPDVVTYNCLINGCCKTNRIERALELLEDMVKRGIAPNRITYNSFIRYYSATNEIDKAIEMLRKMQEMNHGVLPCNSSYTPIIHALCETGMVVEARDFLVELAEQGSIPREYTYKLVCDALESAGKIDLLDAEFCTRLEDGIKDRIKEVMKIKPLLQHYSV